MRFEIRMLWQLSQHLKNESAVGKLHMGDTLNLQFAGGNEVSITAASHEACFLFNNTKIPLFLMLKDRGPRFYRECYVKDREIRWATSEGMMDFAHIFVEGDGARWAILRDAEDRYVLADLWETVTDDDREAIRMGKHHVLETRDAAIAASKLL